MSALFTSCSHLLFNPSLRSRASRHQTSVPLCPVAVSYKMCYFDQELFTCNDWKWCSFSQPCSKACRGGETCSVRLIMATRYVSQKCNLCKQIEVKRRRISKLDDNIRRWSAEPERWRASIERSKDDIRHLHDQIIQREMARSMKQNNLR
ncbi:hypothetical protein B0J14DRAFT_601232 [Halenospora varia]|nr:hypothetical protein B0J14DRAFT_601232 [Halenospora varia]